MKTSVILGLLVIIGLGSLSTTSCLVTRRSEGYACDGDGDCTSGRVCDRGYCVPATCPSVCTSCDLTDKTCSIVCSSSNTCGAVVCPPGYDCTIKCSNPNACSAIDCRASAGCDITCSGQSACGPITCGPQACQIDCTSTGACSEVNCVDSCQCDIKCNNNACPTSSCPQPGGLLCTEDGTAATPCASSASSTCDTCP